MKMERHAEIHLRGIALLLSVVRICGVLGLLMTAWLLSNVALALAGRDHQSPSLLELAFVFGMPFFLMMVLDDAVLGPAGLIRRLKRSLSEKSGVQYSSPSFKKIGRQESMGKIKDIKRELGQKHGSIAVRMTYVRIIGNGIVSIIVAAVMTAAALRAAARWADWDIQVLHAPWILLDVLDDSSLVLALLIVLLWAFLWIRIILLNEGIKSQFRELKNLIEGLPDRQSRDDASRQ